MLIRKAKEIQDILSDLHYIETMGTDLGIKLSISQVPFHQSSLFCCFQNGEI